MAKGRKNGTKKRRTREHVIADLAVNHVGRQVRRCGYTMHRIIHDYGLDGAVTTYSDGGDIESGVIWLQLKATDHCQMLKGKPAVAVRVERKDLLSWLREVYPVIVVIYDAVADQAFWLHVQASLRGGKVFEMIRSGASVTVHVPADQIVDENGVRQWHELKEQALTPW